MPDAASALPENVSALPPGTRLGEFEIKSLLGVGGFGIVYLAFDHALEREVAVKEYMPASMAGRTETMHVSLRSKSDQEVFALGLRSFVNEAKLLAKFDHPSLIKVHRFWEANGTAYMAMPVLRGRTLKDVRKSAGRAPDEAWVRALLTPLLGALEQLHAEGVYHRDIAPDNIHLEAEGRPVLLDFGAARRVISGKTQTLTAILKPAYAPIEQYAESSVVKQGPWTDLYALGATLHYMLLGYPPAPATTRTVADEATELTSQPVAGVSPQLLGIVDWMLAPKPAARPQSVGALRAVLEGRAPLPARATPAPPAQWDKAALAAPVTVPLGEPEPTDIDPDTGTPGLAPSPKARKLEATRALPQGLAAGPEALPVTARDAHRLTPPPARSRAVPLTLAGLALAAALGYVGFRQWGGLGEAGVAGSPAASAAAGPPPTAAAGTPGAAGAAGAGAAGSAQGGASSPSAAAPAAVAVPAATTAATITDEAASAPTGTAASAAGVAATATAAPAAPAATVAAPAAATAAPAASARGPAAATTAAVRPAGPTAPAPIRPAGPDRSAQSSPTERIVQQGPAAAVPAPPTAATPTAPAVQGTASAAAGGGTAGSAGAAAPGAAPPSAAIQAEPGPGATPEARCSGRNPLSHFVCMERECLRPRFRNHPECQAWRQQARPRDASGG
jgi:serine/threonine protein kinase